MGAKRLLVLQKRAVFQTFLVNMKPLFSARFKSTV
jgi:hypothetical protein